MHTNTSIARAIPAVAVVLFAGAAVAGEPPAGQPQYCPYFTGTLVAPRVLVPDPKSVSHMWRASYNCWKSPDYSNQQLMYFTAAPRKHSEAFPQNQMFFDWDEDGALLLVDVTGGITCAVEVEYWSEDGNCLPMEQ